jgi:Flp pilus assembly protein TadB
MIDNTAAAQARQGAHETSLPPASPIPSLRAIGFAACSGVAFPLALSLLFGKLWIALSLLAGGVLSFAVCGMLFVFVEKIMPVAMRGLLGGAAGAGAKVSLVPFYGVALLKFVVIALLAWAIFACPRIGPLGVVAGFVVAQVSIVILVVKTGRSTQRIREAR